MKPKEPTFGKLTPFFQCENEEHVSGKFECHHFLAIDMWRMEHSYWCNECHDHFYFMHPDHYDEETTLQEDLTAGKAGVMTVIKEPEIWVGKNGGVRIMDEKAFFEHPEVKARMEEMQKMDIIGKTLGSKHISTKRTIL